MTNCTSHCSAYSAIGEVVISVSNWSLVETVIHIIKKNVFWHVHKFPNNEFYVVFLMASTYVVLFGVARRRQWQPTPVHLPVKSHGQRSLVGCSSWSREELNTTERLHFDFSLSCIGEGNGNPLQCSCLENPRDGGAWWTAVYGVVQNWPWLKRLSSSRKTWER